MSDDRIEQDLRDTLRRDAPQRVPEELVRRVASIPDHSPQPGRGPLVPRLLAAGAGFAAVAVVAVFAFMTLSRPPVATPGQTTGPSVGGSPSVPPTTTATLPSATPTARPTPSPVSLDYAFTSVTLPAVSGGTLTLNDATLAADGTIVAVGGATDAGEAVVMTSTDGRTWQRVADQTAFHDRAGSLAMTGVRTSSSGLLVAVGTLTATGRSPHMAAWWSSDGTSWQRAADQSVFGSASPSGGLVATSDGFAAAGQRQGAPAIWTTADGQTWTLARTPAAATGARISAIAVGGPGLVAVGASTSPSASYRPAVWTSSDGGHVWTGDAAAPGLVPGYNGGLAYSFTGLACSTERCVAGAAVSAGNGGAFAGISLIRWGFESADGLRWTGHDVSNVGSGTQLDEVTWTGGVFVASGDSVGGGQRMVWTSKDGATWKQLSIGSAASAAWSKLVAAGDVVLALPAPASNGKQASDLWVGRPA